MRSHHILFVALIALVAHSASAQQGPPRGEPVSGIVKSVAADNVVLTTAKGDVTIAITPQTRVTVAQTASASDIKPGTYLGTSNQNAATPDAGTATEVHLAADGPNVNRAMNDSGLTMTNGHVKNVARTATGQEMDIDYGEGKTRHVVVSDSTPITKMADVGMAALKPGTSVNAMTTTGANGKLSTNMIMIGSPGASRP